MTVANSQGGTAFSFRNDHGGEPFFGRPATDRSVKTLGDMLYAPRYVASFDLTDSQTLVAGASAAFGPNSSGGNADTQKLSEVVLAESNGLPEQQSIDRRILRGELGRHDRAQSNAPQRATAVRATSQPLDAALQVVTP